MTVTTRVRVVVVRESCRVIADDGERRQEFVLDRPTRGVTMPLSFLLLARGFRVHL